MHLFEKNEYFVIMAFCLKIIITTEGRVIDFRLLNF